MKPNRDVTIHQCFFENQKRKVISAIKQLLSDDPNAKELQVIDTLLEVCADLSNPSVKTSGYDQEVDNNCAYQELKE